ncbi:AgrD family cyclic lactone autoinducer peptide [Clostridioides difficile]|nr:cyclic lactone autoinducer peptide [Clostridioides difficile]MDV9719643.1 cyclic lactone autoinducer peptide [Clostridioides difficile]
MWHVYQPKTPEKLKKF